jgi:hypothetical protein
VVFKGVAVDLLPGPPSRVGVVRAQQDRHDPGLDGSGWQALSGCLRRPADPDLGAMREHGRKYIVARTFSIATTVDASSLLKRARKAASENDANLVGDEGSGRFSHEMVRGEYRLIGRTVVVTITEKHWLLPWPIVEAQLRELVQ